MGNSNKDSYTQIPNDLLEAVISYKYFTNLQRRIVLYVIRKTLGWNKKSDAVSIRKMAEFIGTDRSNVSKAVSDLAKSNVLKVEGPLTGKPKKMSVLPVDYWDKPVVCTPHVVISPQNLWSGDHTTCGTDTTPTCGTDTTYKIHSKYTSIKKEKKASPFSDYELTPEEIAEGWEA